MKASPTVELVSKRRPAHGRARRRHWRILIAIALLAGALAGCMRGESTIKWTEDVLLPDGRTVTLKRYQEFKGPSEIGQPPSESYYWFEFKHPDTGEIVRWETKREPGTVALLIHQKSVMLLASPMFGSGMRALGCPNPPYLLYRYGGGKWESVDLSSIPIKRLRSNMTYAAGDRVAAIKSENGHLGVATTSNARYQNRPWVMDFTDVKQTFDQFNCVNELNNLLDKEVEGFGESK